MRYFLSLLFLYSALMLPAQTSLFDALHATEDSLTIQIDTDWKDLMRWKKRKVYQPLTLRLTRQDSVLVLRGKIRARQRPAGGFYGTDGG